MLDLYSMSADLSPRTILRIEVVLRRSGLKRTMLYDLIAKGQFPKQVALGARAVGWYEDEVDEWVRNRDSAEKISLGISTTGKRLATIRSPTLFAPAKSGLVFHAGSLERAAV